MATWQSIREETLLLLDLPVDLTEGDVVDLINIKLKREIDALVTELWPDELLRKTSSFTITPSTTEILLSDFGLTSANILAPWSFSVDFQDGVSADEKMMEHIDYLAWIQGNNIRSGNTRSLFSWTYSPDQKIYLASWPSGTQEWLGYLYYYARPAALTDLGEPEIPYQHHSYFAPKVALEFPQFFQGERQLLLPALAAQVAEKRKRLFNNRSIARKNYQLKIRSRRSARSVIWPGYQES